MNCTRCKGLVVDDPLFAHEVTTQSDRMWRCINCGWRGDTVSMENFKAPHPHHGTLTDHKTKRLPVGLRLSGRRGQ